MSSGLDDRVKNLEEALAITKGRVDGMHALLLTIARHLPPQIAAECAKQVEVAAERITADLLALPLPNATVEEVKRVMAQGAEVLKHAAKS
jgi:hypothetical protein